MKLNCDMGEHFGIWENQNDKLLAPYIDIANLACGFHSSDPLNMDKSVALIKSCKKEISAHPSYPDIVGFGRRSINCSYEEIKSMILYQIGALEGICKNHELTIQYVKPHGALYNDMMKDISIFEAIVDAISNYDKNLKLFILSTSNNNQYQQVANQYGIELLFEVFMDRNYTCDGYLTKRDQENSVISDIDEVLKRLNTLIDTGALYSQNGTKLQLQADTICVHSDSPNSLELIKSINNVLRNS